MFEYTNIISFVLRYYCLTVYMGAVFEKKFREISKKNIMAFQRLVFKLRQLLAL